MEAENQCFEPIDRDAARGQVKRRFQTASRIPPVAKPDLGTKRLCASCGAKFYDLSKDPIVCPKCETVFHPVVLSTRSRPPRRRARLSPRLHRSSPRFRRSPTSNSSRSKRRTRKWVEPRRPPPHRMSMRGRGGRCRGRRRRRRGRYLPRGRRRRGRRRLRHRRRRTRGRGGHLSQAGFCGLRARADEITCNRRGCPNAAPTEMGP